ncbi:MAG: GDSL-type esterase/lipase family protein [Mucilaginibacter sp.]
MKSNRRNFIKTAALSTFAVISIPDIVAAAIPSANSKKIKLEKNDVILFQGDSITDWGRDKNNPNPNDFGALGSGYPLLTATQLLSKFPDKSLQIYNRGISGNKVFQLSDRWENECLNLKPNVLSILIGVNDYWHTLTAGYTGTIEVYKNDYQKLIDRTRKALPDIKLIIGEPFAVKGVKAVDDKWYPAFNGYRQAARDIADQFDATLIPYQSIYDKAVEIAPGSYWTSDGVHPTAAGAGLMAHAWMEMVKG